MNFSFENQSRQVIQALRFHIKHNYLIQFLEDDWKKRQRK